MKTAGLTLLIALLAGLVAFGLTRYFAAAPPGDELAWLRREFRLTPGQAEAIVALHAAYEPICSEHCARILEARERVDQLAQQGRQESAEYQQALAERERWTRLCTEATQRHLQAVADAMSPEQGRRYLELIGPKVTQHEHTQPFGLR